MKTVNVRVTIQIDINDNDDALTQVAGTLDLMNEIVGMSQLDAQPQILTSDISASDIDENENNEDLSFSEERRIEKAGAILCDNTDDDGNEISIARQIELIEAEDDESIMIDNVEGVLVWEKLVNSLTCKEFLTQIDY